MFGVIRMLLALMVLAGVAVHVWFLWFLSELERHRCACALTWHRRVMQVAITLLVLLNVLTLLGLLLAPSPWWALAIMALELTYVVTTRLFVQHVKATPCACAAHARAFRVLDLFNLFMIAWLAVSAGAAVAGALLSPRTTRRP